MHKKVWVRPKAYDVELQVNIGPQLRSIRCQTDSMMVPADKTEQGNQTLEIDESKFSKIMSKVLTEKNHMFDS